MTTPDQPAHIAVTPLAGVQTPDGTAVDNTSTDLLDVLIDLLLGQGADPNGLDDDTIARALTAQLGRATWDGERWAVEAFTEIVDDGVRSVSIVVEHDDRLGRCALLAVRN